MATSSAALLRAVAQARATGGRKVAISDTVTNRTWWCSPGVGTLDVGPLTPYTGGPHPNPRHAEVHTVNPPKGTAPPPSPPAAPPAKGTPPAAPPATTSSTSSTSSDTPPASPPATNGSDLLTQLGRVIGDAVLARQKEAAVAPPAKLSQGLNALLLFATGVESANWDISAMALVEVVKQFRPETTLDEQATLALRLNEYVESLQAGAPPGPASGAAPGATPTPTAKIG
jgi:hypothetical protein